MGFLRFATRQFDPDVVNVETEQVGRDVNITVSGITVAYFEGETNDFRINTQILSKMGIEVFNQEGTKVE